MAMEFRKHAAGEFELLRDGAATGYWVVNGSRGTSGRDTPNVYGITTPAARVHWIGTPAAAKRIALAWESKAHASAAKSA